MKLCNSCKQLKSFEEFNKCLSNKDGRQYKCRICEPFAARKRRERNKLIHLNPIKIPTHKICYICKENKEIKQFHHSASNTDGFQSACARCNRALYEESTKEQRMLIGAKSRAKEYNLPFDLSKQDIINIWPADNKCYGCLCTFRALSDKKTSKSKSPTLDKIIPHLGYVKNNIRILCRKCNLTKNNHIDPNILRRLADQLEKDIAKL